jgi:formylglycine-generating enzyme required for sulfatase activity
VWILNFVSTCVPAVKRHAKRSKSTVRLLTSVLAAGLFLAECSAQDKDVSNFVENSVGMRLTVIPSGEFMMGAPDDELGSRIDERPVHQVKISTPFLLGVYEVTQAEYEKVTGVNPSYFSLSGPGKSKVEKLDVGRLPVEQVSWDDCIVFCEKLSALPEEKAAGRVYRLPTEAEWQYSCRAGSTGPFNTGASLGATDANFNGNFPYGDAPRGVYLGRTSIVGSYKPNSFGLYDMHGNVAELTADRYGRHYYKESPAVDPKGPESGNDRVVLGGSWGTDAARCRSAFRRSNATSGKAYYFGFRVACDLPAAGN